MPDRIDKDPYYKLDPGSPHMDSEDYRHMGIPEGDNQIPGEPNEALASEIRSKLEGHERIDASRIQVEVRGDTAILTGVAGDRHARGRAEELAKEVDGVANVVNKIAVQTEDAGRPTLTTQMPGANNEGTTQRS